MRVAYSFGRMKTFPCCSLEMFKLIPEWETKTYTRAPAHTLTYTQILTHTHTRTHTHTHTHTVTHTHTHTIVTRTCTRTYTHPNTHNSNNDNGNIRIFTANVSNCNNDSKHFTTYYYPDGPGKTIRPTNSTSWDAYKESCH